MIHTQQADNSTLVCRGATLASISFIDQFLLVGVRVAFQG